MKNIMQFAKYSNTCWWQYSKQCLKDPCEMCYLFLPLLQGMLDRPNFSDFEDGRMKECLVEAFVKKNLKIERATNKKKVKLTKKEREAYLEKVQAVLKTIPQIKR